MEVVILVARTETALDLETLEARLQEIQKKREQLQRKYEEQEQRLRLQIRGAESGRKTAGGIRRLEVSYAMVLYRYVQKHMPKVYAHIVAEADGAGYITRADVRKFAGLSPLPQTFESDANFQPNVEASSVSN